MRLDPEEFDPGREYDRWLDLQAEQAYLDRQEAAIDAAGQRATFDGELLSSGDNGDPYWSNLR